MKKILFAALMVLGMAVPGVAGDFRTTVVGIGSDSRYPHELYDRGLQSAIFEVRVCSITGHFSNRSRCYALYANGRAEYVNANNRHLVRAFLAKLQRQARGSHH